jgi:hypothetical protein
VCLTKIISGKDFLAPSSTTTNTTCSPMASWSAASSRRAGRAIVDVDTRLWSSKDRTPTHGYEATREAAMAAFANSWRRE